MKNIKNFVLLSLMAMFAINVQAQFGGSGSGTASDPYLITNEDELFDVRNDLSANYKLMADLDLTEWIAEESPKDGWNPIGKSYAHVLWRGCILITWQGFLSWVRPLG